MADECTIAGMKNLAAVTLAVALVSGGLLLEAGSAHADVPPPNMTCGDKKAGDACVDDSKKGGSCAASKCSRMGVVQGPNGTTERKVVEYDCMLCVAGGAATATSGSPSSPSEKKGCNTSGADDTNKSDASLFAMAALGLAAWRRRTRR